MTDPSNFPIPDCDMCGDELDEPGALILGVPDEYETVKKWHVCVCAFCYDTILLGMLRSPNE